MYIFGIYTVGEIKSSKVIKVKKEFNVNLEIFHQGSSWFERLTLWVPKTSLAFGNFQHLGGLKYYQPSPPPPSTIHSNTCGNFFRSIFSFKKKISLVFESRPRKSEREQTYVLFDLLA